MDGSQTWCLRAFCSVYAALDSRPHWYATGCRKWINGLTEARATLIYPVSVLQWWDVKAYCQAIFISFVSAPFDSSQYLFATYGCDSWAWQQQVASKGGIIIWYSSLSWIRLSERCPGVKLKIVDSKNDFLSLRVFISTLGGHTRDQRRIIVPCETR